jgi:hypothetical protein
VGLLTSGSIYPPLDPDDALYEALQSTLRRANLTDSYRLVELAVRALAWSYRDRSTDGWRILLDRIERVSGDESMSLADAVTYKFTQEQDDNHPALEAIKHHFLSSSNVYTRAGLAHAALSKLSRSEYLDVVNQTIAFLEEHSGADINGSLQLSHVLAKDIVKYWEYGSFSNEAERFAYIQQVGRLAPSLKRLLQVVARIPGDQLPDQPWGGFISDLFRFHDRGPESTVAPGLDRTAGDLFFEALEEVSLFPRARKMLQVGQEMRISGSRSSVLDE